jgi:hypothetical protein
MKEEELVDGAEYEGDYTDGTRLVRGIVRRDMDYCCFTMGGDSRKRVTLWQEDGGFGYHAWLDSLRRVESTTRERKVGDRVEWDDSKNVRRCGFAGMCAGEIVELGADGVGAFARVRLTPGVEAKLRGATWHVDTELLRPVSSPPAIAEKDRLHEGEFNCALCGAEEFLPGDSFRKSGKGNLSKGNGFASNRYACAKCRDKFWGQMDWRAVDREITRRKLIAANAQPPAESNRNARHCDKCMNPVVGGTLCKEHVEALGKPAAAKVDPYAVHNAKYREPLVALETAERDRLDTDKQRQAFRELDRGIKGKRYPYAESSLVFSSATWESD